MNIEVELRSFISKEKYEELITFFTEYGELQKEDEQETHYFDGEQDLRIQKNQNFAKVWLKKGELHDDAREEIEIKTPINDFNKLNQLFQTLGYKTEIKWFRKRHQFSWQGVTVCVDHTKGYGYILELEKMCEEHNKEQSLQELREKLQALKIEETPKEEFKQKFRYYKENWQQLTS